MALSFGSTATGTKPTSGFSFGSPSTFGAPTTNNATKPTGFSFGSSNASASSGGAFGSKPSTTSTGFSFGSSLTGNTKSSSGFSGFGSNKGSSSFNFGSLGNSSANNQSKQNVPKNVLTAEDYKDQLAMALMCPQLFGDERDNIIAKWNQLQAAWGFGRAVRHNNMDPIKLTAKNVFCRFKAMGYSRMPESRDKDGLVYLQIDKKLEIVKAHQQEFLGELQNILGNQLNLMIKIDNLIELPEDKCEIAIYIQEQLNMSTGAAPSKNDTYRVPTSVLYANLIQIEDKLKTRIGISEIKNRVAMTEEEISNYLESPPPGVSEIQWINAKKNNPDVKKLVPIPMLGFSQLASTHIHQRLLCEQQLVRISKIQEKIKKLNEINNERQQQIVKYRDNANELSRKLLRLICRQEIARNSGVEGINKNEQIILVALESVALKSKQNIKLNCRIADVKSFMKIKSNSDNFAMINHKESNSNIYLSNLNESNNDQNKDYTYSDPSNAELNEETFSNQNNVLDKESEIAISELLEDQQKQLDNMVKMTQVDINDLSTIKKDVSGMR